MKYLLDTNICVYALKREANVLRRLKELSPDDVGISIVTLAELWFGARKSTQSVRTRSGVDAFVRPFDVVAFDPPAAETYAELRLLLERAGRPIGERDLLIASTARSRNLVLVTHNRREFAQVPGLTFEDWID